MQEPQAQPVRVAALERCETLTSREREVMHMVVTGTSSKQIADDLGVNEATVKTHRGHVMQEIRATWIAELVGRTTASLQRH